MNPALLLLLGGVVIAIWLYLWTRQRMPDAVDGSGISTSAPDSEGVIILRGMGQVVYVNETVRAWLGIEDAAISLEQIARQARPADSLFGLLAGRTQAAFELGDRWVEASVYDVPGDAEPRRMIVLREAGSQPNDTRGGLDFTRAFSVLNRASEMADITAGVEPTLQALLTVLQSGLTFDAGEINLYTEAGDTLSPQAWYGDSRYILAMYEKGGTYHTDQGVTGWLLNNRQTLILNSPEEIAVLNPLVQPFPYKSVLGAPLILRNQVIGTIELASDKPGSYSQADATLLFALNEFMASVIFDAQEYAIQIKRVDDITSLQSLVDQTSGRTEAVFGLLAQRIGELIGAAVCVILLRTAERESLKVTLPAYGVPDGFARTWEIDLINSGVRDIIERQTYWMSGALNDEPLVVPLGIEPVLFPLGLKNTLWVPLQSGGTRIGMLAVFNKLRSAEFTTRDIQNLRALASQAAVVVESVRLLVREQRLDAELEGLQEMTFAIGALTGDGDFYQELTARIANLMKARACILLLLDETGTRLEAKIPVTGLLDALVRGYTIEISPGSVFAALWDEDDVWFTNNTSGSTLIAAARLEDRMQLADIQRTMFARLSIRGQLIGVLQLADPVDNRDFDDGDGRLLTIFATQAATILENARLFQALQVASQRAERLRRIAEIAGGMNQLTDSAQELLAAVSEVTESPLVFITLLEGSELVTIPERVFGLTLAEPQVINIYSQGFQYSVYISRRPYLNNDILADPRLIPVYREIASTLGLRSAVMVPLIVGDRNLGELGIANRARPYEENDVTVLTTIAAQIAAAIDRVQLYEATGQNLARRLDELDAISRISNELAQTVDFERVVNVIRREALRVTNADYCTVALLKPVEEWAAPDHPEMRRRIGTLRDTVNLEILADVERRAVELGTEPLLLADYAQQTELAPLPRDARSALAVGISFLDSIIGVIHLLHMQPDHFDDVAATFMQTLATKAALGYGSYIRYEEQRERSEALRQRVEQLNRIFELGSLLASSTTTDELLEAVAFSVQQSAGFDQVLMLMAGEDGLLHRAAQAGMPLDAFERTRNTTAPVSTLQRVLDERFQIEYGSSYLLPAERSIEWRTPQLISLLNTSFDGQRSVSADEPDSWREGDLLILSMVGSSGRLLGAMVMDRPFNDKRPDRVAVELLEIFAYQAANAVESSRLYNQADSLRILNESIVDSIPQSIAVLDRNGAIITANRTLRSLPWGADAVGRSLDEIQPALGDLLVTPIRNALTRGEAHETLGYMLRDAVGERAVNLSVSPLRSPEGISGAVIVIEDVTERTRLEEAIQVRADQLSALTQAASAVSSSSERAEVLATALREMRNLLAYDHMTIWRRAGSNLFYEAGSDPDSAEMTDPSGEPLRIRINDFAALRLVADTQQTAVLNLTGDSGVGEYGTLPPGSDDASAWMGIPMINQGNVTGIITLSSQTLNAFDALSDQNIVLAFASQVANAASNAELFMQAFERTNEMSTLLEAAQATAAVDDLDALLSAVAGLMFSVVEMDQCAVFLWDEIENSLELRRDVNRRNDDDRERKPGTRYDLARYRTKLNVIRAREPLALTLESPELEGDDLTEMRERGEHVRLLVPLVAAEGVVGLVQLEQYMGRPQTITPQNLRMARALGGQIATAIQKARLSAQMTIIVAESFALNDLSMALSSNIRVEDLMNSIRLQLPQVITVSDFYVALYDARTEIVSFPVALRAHQPIDMPSRPLGNDEISSVIRHNRMISFGADYFSPEELRRNLGIDSGEEDYKSYLAVPIAIGQRVYGALAMRDSVRTGAFSLNDQRVLTTVAAQLAAILQNTELFEQVRSLADDLEQQVIARTAELQDERDRLGTLYQITSELSRTLDMRALENRALTMLIKAVNGDDGLMMRFDAISDELVASAVYHPSETGFHHPGEFIGRWLIDQGETELNLPNLREWEGWNPDSGDEWSSAVAVALQATDGEALGAIVVLSREVNAFEEAAVRLLAAAANQVAVTINNAQLYGLIREQADRLGIMLRDQQEEAEKNAAILDSISDGVILTDATGKVVVSNPAAQRLLSLPSDELFGRPLADFSGMYAGSIAGWIARVLAGTENEDIRDDVEDEEFRLALNGLIVSVRLSPVFSGGRLLGMVSVLRDITREADIDRMKAEFIANVSHELRTPLTPIKGFTEMLMMGALGAITEPQKNTLGMIRDNVTRLTVLIEDILDISRIDSGRDTLRLADLDIAELVREAVDKQTNRPQHKDKTRDIEVDIASDLPTLQADRAKVARVLGSIVDNAFNYTQDGGTIQVRVRQEDSRMLIAVKDNGIGIPEQYRDVVWRRFQRIEDHALKLEVSGTGLGLSIAKEMVEMHHGSVWFESEVGKGTTFFIALPLVQPIIQVSAAASAD